MSAPVSILQTRLRDELRIALLILAALAAVPLFVSSPYWLGVLIVSLYFAIIATGWNLLAGYAGQFSLAPAAFAMLGAYVPALLSYHWQVPIALGIPAAVLATAAVGYLLGRIVTRLTGPYLALTTLAFAEVLRLVVSNSYEFTRGDQGLNVPALTESRVGYYYLFLVLLLLVLVGVFLMLRARAGRFLQAIRDDELGARSRGIDTVRWKSIAFAVSCALCGVAGAFYGTFAQLVSPELGLVMQTGIVLAMVVIGGIGTLVGPLIGALLVYLSSEWLRDFGGIQLIVFAALVIVFARFLPDGLWGIVKRALGLRPRAPAAPGGAAAGGTR
jgi:branched-chain amino acid transport system permease protein